MKAVKPEDKIVVANATGCLEVSTTLYPYSAWKDSFIHTAFEECSCSNKWSRSCLQSLKGKKVK